MDGWWAKLAAGSMRDCGDSSQLYLFQGLGCRGAESNGVTGCLDEVMHPMSD